MNNKIIPLLFFLLILPSSYAQNSLDCQMGYLEARFNCGIYSFTAGNKIPEALVAAKNYCEINKKIQGCDELAKKSPVSAKYIQSCDYKFLCSRKILEDNIASNFVVKCMEGASDILNK